MTSRRIAKVSQAVRETISSSILRGLKDPRVRNVTVLGVEVSEDTRTAKVKVSVMGTEREQALCLHGLKSARGYLQRKVADRIQTRYTPVLTFVLDSSVKRSVATSRILRELEQEEQDALSPESTEAERPEFDPVHPEETTGLPETSQDEATPPGGAESDTPAAVDHAETRLPESEGAPAAASLPPSESRETNPGNLN